MVVGRHFLSFGKDYNKFFGNHRGFTGTANLVNLNYGKGAFTLKPFTGEDKPDNFLF